MQEVPVGSTARSECAKLRENVENPKHWLFKTNDELSNLANPKGKVENPR